MGVPLPVAVRDIDALPERGPVLPSAAAVHSTGGKPLEIFEEYGIEFLARYGHIISGITWIGLLYYFNFAQTPAFASFEAPARNEAFAKLVPRAIWWFRYAALATLLFGLLLFGLYAGGDNMPYDGMKSGQVVAIITGIIFALV